MSTITPTFTKCVLLLAALLSPLQGTPALCLLLGCGDSVEVTSRNDDQRGSCDCRHCPASQLKPFAEKTVSTAVGVNGNPTHSPCKCPPSCFCRRSPQPSHVPVVEDIDPRSQIVTSPLDKRESVKAICSFHRQDRVSDVFAHSSALDLCAALCRFTT